MWQNRDIKLVTTEARRSYLVSEPNYHTTIFFFFCKFISHINEKEKNMNKSVYLGLSILEICNILMWEFWYDYLWFWYFCVACCNDNAVFVVSSLICLESFDLL